MSATALAFWVALTLSVALALWWRRLLPESPPEPPPAPPGRRRRLLLALALISCLLGLGRATLAMARTCHNVDEDQYAASAAFARMSGESLAAQPRVRLHVALYLLDGQHPLAPADLLTSLAVALSAYLLGLVLLQQAPVTRLALAVPPLVFLGSLPFEGLASNAEPWAALGLSGWLACRAYPPSPGRHLAAGACLGLAALFKEQALPFVLLEPLLLFEPAQPGDPRGRRLLLAAAGFALPLAAYLGWVASAGWLSTYLASLFSWGSSMGTAARSASLGLSGLPTGLSQVLTNPLTPLSALTLAGGWRGGSPLTRRLILGLGLGLLATNLGTRWSLHYFGLLIPFLALLAALGLGQLLRGLHGPQRAPAVLALALTLLAVLWQTLIIVQQPAVACGMGGLPDDDPSARAVAEALDQLPPGQPILVWGWRPDLYRLSGHPPATRYQVQHLWTAPPERVLADLNRYHPGAVVFAGPHDLYPSDDRFDPNKYAWLVKWLEPRVVSKTNVAGYYVLLLRSPGD